MRGDEMCGDVDEKALSHGLQNRESPKGRNPEGMQPGVNRQFQTRGLQGAKREA
jgi:hypothetical protein